MSKITAIQRLIETEKILSPFTIQEELNWAKSTDIGLSITLGRSTRYHGFSETFVHLWNKKQSDLDAVIFQLEDKKHFICLSSSQYSSSDIRTLSVTEVGFHNLTPATSKKIDQLTRSHRRRPWIKKELWSAKNWFRHTNHQKLYLQRFK